MDDGFRESLFPLLTMTTVLKSLADSPENILKYEQAANAFRKQFDLAKISLELVEAEAVLRITDSGDVKNQSILKAMVTTDRKVQEKKAQLLRAEDQWRAAVAMLHEAENEFASARKLGSLNVMEQEIRSIVEP